MCQELLITGGAGFIGSNFIRFLLKNNSNCSISNIDSITYAGNLENMKGFDKSEKYRFLKIDITDTAALNKVFDRTYDVIINFAAESHVDRSIKSAKSFIQTNISGTHALLEKVLEGKARKMIQISTDEVYGSLEKDERPFTEQTALSPNNPYSASKASADLLVQSFYQTYKLPVMITRCSNNYGPYQHPEKFIPTIIYHALNNKPIPLYGDGLNIRDWLYVDDHCSAIHTVMNSGVPGEIYNIGGNNEKTNIEVIRKILNYLEKDERLISYVPDRKGHDRRYSIDSAKIKNQLGWEPTVSFNEGIIQTVDWYVKNMQWVKNCLNRSASL